MDKFIGNYKQIIQYLLEKETDLTKKYEIKKHREKRSLSANAYAWALIGEIADCLNLSKDEVYLTMLKSYGQSQIVSVRVDCPVNGFFKHYEQIGVGTVNGVNFAHYRVFKGSSEFNTKEMSIFINGIVEEAKNLDIQTLDELAIKNLKPN